MVMLYDYRNRPIKTAELTREQAAPSLTGIRTIWNDTVASGLTPVGLANLLQAAGDGDAHAYLTLAEEMEERDLHYAGELAKRKLAVSRLPVTVESATDETRDKEIADAVRLLVKKPGFRTLLKDCLDAIGKGYAAVEIIWRRGNRWMPERYEWRDPRFFQFDLESKSKIRLRDEADLMNGIEPAPYKFIVHIHRGKSGIPIRGGVARLAAWSFMCKGYTIKDWLAFAEVFGMPLRMGKYGQSATQDEINILKTAVANLGSDAAAVFPENMLVELVEAGNKGGSADFFQRLADYLDAQVSKGILGQTASASGTPGKLGNDKLQSDVRDDIRDDDAEALEETINRDLVRPFVDLNFGPQENYPEVQIRAIEREDVAALVSAVEKLVPLGLKVEQSVMRDKLGLPDPDPKAGADDLLTPAPSVGMNVPAPALQRAMNASQAETDEQLAVDKLGMAVSDTMLQDQAEKMLGELISMAQDGDDYQSLQERLAEGLPELSSRQMEEMLARVLFLAETWGRIHGGS